MYVVFPNSPGARPQGLIQHFHKFVEVLEKRGVDISKVRISKAEAALWGYVLLVPRQRFRA